MRSRQWSNFLKSLYLNMLPSALLFILVLLLILHLDTVLFIFIVLYLCFFFCFCMSYGKIELFTQWNKNVLNDFRPVFSVNVFFNVELQYNASPNRCTFYLSTKHLQVVYVVNGCQLRVCLCVPAMADMQSVDVPRTGWVRVWAAWRGNSRGWEHIWQVCTAYVVTWCL